MDIMTASERSERMRLIRSKDTTPEMAVRRLIHGMGYRYRLHSSKVAGKPDLVFKSRRKAIFVHGCLWHSHDGCRLNRPPKSRLEYWQPKLERNRQRDTEAQSALRKMGWQYLIVWECEVEKKGGMIALASRIRNFLDAPITPSSGPLGQV